MFFQTIQLSSFLNPSQANPAQAEDRQAGVEVSFCLSEAIAIGANDPNC